MRREILFQLSDVARSMRTYIDQRAREHGMTRAQWGALVRLERQEGMTQAELAEGLEIQPISLVRLIDRLCQPGLVERRPHPRDRRANRLYLTDKGHATFARLMPLGARSPATCSPPSSEADIADLLRKLLLHQAQHPQGRRQAQAAHGAQAEWRQASVRVMAGQRVHAAARSAARGLQAAVLAHDADGDPAGAGRRRRPVLLSFRAAATCPPTTPTSAPRRC